MARATIFFAALCLVVALATAAPADLEDSGRSLESSDLKPAASGYYGGYYGYGLGHGLGYGGYPSYGYNLGYGYGYPYGYNGYSSLGYYSPYRYYW